MKHFQPGEFCNGPEIARGAMSVIRTVRHLKTGAVYVTKSLTPELQDDPKAQKDIAREGRILSSLNSASVVAIYGSFIKDGVQHLVLEYVRAGDGPAETLEERVRRLGGLDAESTWLIVGQTSSALKHVHDRKVVVRDVKASNVLLPGNDSIKLVDFGLAAEAPTPPGLASERLCDAESVEWPETEYDYFPPPEVCLGREWSPSGDLFQVGLLTYFALTGEYPFRRGKLDACLEGVPALEGSRRGGRLRTLMEATLRPEPQDRVKECAEALAILNNS